MQFFFWKYITFIEDDDNRHSIGLSASQESIDEGSRSLRIIHRYHKQRLVYISCQNMTLLTEVRWFTNDIVLAVFDRRDKCRTLLVGNKLYIIAYSHRIGAADALQSEIALDFTFYQLAIVCLDGVPAACIFNNESSHYHLLNNVSPEWFRLSWFPSPSRPSGFRAAWCTCRGVSANRSQHPSPSLQKVHPW